MSFLICEAQNRVKKENKLIKLSKIINWENIRKRLKGMYAYEINGKGGQKPYDSLKMYKAVLLGQWYSLSDPELEEALEVRLDFMLFTGLEGEVPDETTLCRFRNRLAEKGLDKVLFNEIKKVLEEAGLKVKKCEGAVIDATVIESAYRPNTTVEIMPEDRREENVTEEPENKINYSKDPEARWLKKGKKCYFGYKGFISADSKDGYIDVVHVTSANKSEVRELANIIPKNKPKRIYADKGYASKENRNKLKARNIKDGIMEKATRSKCLTKWQKKKNRIISAKRFIVEQAFGTLKRRFKFTKAAYITRIKVEAQFTLKATCFNLLKAVNKVELVLEM
ncbi:MAG: IS5 family transposase [Candidatus Omnitrophica bacterium]|nr:IS5 family transposase [Candidatus Omnitrophota bacterium]MBU1894234.1 IS5 family transposase [Candidatus Omnitrophota bacterium]